MVESQENDVSSTTTEFSVFYREELKPLIRFCVYQGASVQEAQDAVQEAMVAVFKRGWATIDNPRAYVRKAAQGVFLRNRKKDQRQRDLERRAAQDHAHLPAVEPAAENVLAALRTLPAAQREVMAWVMDDYTPSEIAELTNQNPATVRSHLRHARAKLARILHR